MGRILACFRARALGIVSGFVDPVAIKVTHDDVLTLTLDLKDSVGRIEPSIAIAIDDHPIATHHGNLVDSIPIEIAHDGDISRLAELGVAILLLIELAIPVDIQNPSAIQENSQGRYAIAVEVTCDGLIPSGTETKHVIDHIRSWIPLASTLHEPYEALCVLARWQVLWFGFEPVVWIGQARFAFDGRTIACSSDSPNTDVVLAIAIPIPDDRQIADRT